jgi:hypothetical protein
MRHWLFGGRTDVANLVLLCDADHGLVHDLDLVMSRRDGRLVVTTPDGRRVWGTADAAFTAGLDALDRPLEGDAGPAVDAAAFAGVHPIDTARGRRPVPRTAPAVDRSRQDPGPTRSASVSTLLFPRGEPDLPDAMRAGGEPMSIAYAVSVLIGHRDFVRRMAAESGVAVAA